MKKAAAVIYISVFCSMSGMLMTACSTDITEKAALTAGTVASAENTKEAISTEACGRKTESAASDKSAAEGGKEASEDIISCKYYDEKDFRASVSRADTLKPLGKTVYGGIVPHHLLACDMIARFFKSVSFTEPEVIVVIAPNHKRTGSTPVSTGSWSWQTPFGRLDADEVLAGYLMDNRSAGASIGLLEEDHSISALVPYIRYYMPSVKIVPVMLHGNLGRKESEKLGTCLAEQLKGRKSLVVASVDFSHYLPPEKAELMDKSTLKAIDSMDIQAISRMGNDNLDSPPSIMTLLSYMKSIGASRKEVPEHGNSSTITGKWSSSTTSYFAMTWQKTE